MDVTEYQAIGPDRPMGDREGEQKDWSPEQVKQISDEEVKSPQNGNDIDEEAPDDPDKRDQRSR